MEQLEDIESGTIFEYANYNRINQINTILNKAYIVLKIFCKRGYINSNIGYEIQQLLIERKTIFHNHPIIKDVIQQELKEKCLHSRKNLNKSVKNQHISLCLTLEIQLRQQSLKSPSLKPTKEEMKASFLSSKQQLVQLFKNSEKAFTSS